jgi:hypothetical protein
MNTIFLEGQKSNPILFQIVYRNSHQKLLLTHHKMKQIAVISLTTMKPIARKQPQPSKKYKVLPNALDKTVVSLL